MMAPKLIRDIAARARSRALEHEPAAEPSPAPTLEFRSANLSMVFASASIVSIFYHRADPERIEIRFFSDAIEITGRRLAPIFNALRDQPVGFLEAKGEMEEALAKAGESYIRAIRWFDPRAGGRK